MTSDPLPFISLCELSVAFVGPNSLTPSSVTPSEANRSDTAESVEYGLDLVVDSVAPISLSHASERGLDLTEADKTFSHTKHRLVKLQSLSAL